MRTVRRWVGCAAMACLLLGGKLLGAGELHVTAGADAGGDGSLSRPMATIGEALKLAEGGDEVIVHGGIYSESITITQSGTPEKPTVLRAAAGERAIISGMAPITGWKPWRDGVFVAEFAGKAEDLFVGWRAQRVSCWPGEDLPLRSIAEVDTEARSVSDVATPSQEIWLQAVAGEPRSARLFLYVARGNYFADAGVQGIDASTGRWVLDDARAMRNLAGRGDRYRLINHLALIRQPGQWAMVAGADRTTFYFRPADPADLEHTQTRVTRRNIFVGVHNRRVAHVRIEGLEITGSTGHGIHIQSSDHVTLANCIIHGNDGNGVFARQCSDLALRSNIVVSNGNGVGIASSRRVVVEANEIALNLVDGLIVAGNISGRPGGEPETSDVLVRRNYIHHHCLMGHPDNIQMYRGVSDVRFEDNVSLWAGQSLMTEEAANSSIRNCVFIGSAAVGIIFGHGNSHGWTIEHSTIGMGGWGVLSLTDKDYRVHRNLIVHNSFGQADGTSSDHNRFVTMDESQPIRILAKPKWQSLKDPAEVAAAIGQEANSTRGPWPFRHAPSRQAMVVGSDVNRLDRLTLRQAERAPATAGFAAGDRIEISGDGVVRRVTAVEGDAITFAPALSALPLRDALVWNWKDAESFALDLRPVEGQAPIADVGATLSIPAYQRGDFDDDGRRDLPVLPDDVRQALPNPNAIVLPIHGR